MNQQQPPSVPPPSMESISLVVALSSAENRDLHVKAIQARDAALSASPESYSTLCHELLKILLHADQIGSLIPSSHGNIHSSVASLWSSTAPNSGIVTLESKWLHLGQISGLMLKNAIRVPPHQTFAILPPVAMAMRPLLLQSLQCSHAPLRNVASTILATAVTFHPGSLLHVSQWADCVDYLLLQSSSSTHGTDTSNNCTLGAALTLQKILQDQPYALSTIQLDAAIPVWIQQTTTSSSTSGSNNTNSTPPNSTIPRIAIDCLSRSIPRQPAALVAHWTDYLQALSGATAHSPGAVCQSLTAIVQYRPAGLITSRHNAGATSNDDPLLQSILSFLCSSTAQTQDEGLALDACDFWLTMATTANDEVDRSSLALYSMVEQQVLPQLIPILLQQMVYTEEQRLELEAAQTRIHDQQQLQQQQQQQPSGDNPYQSTTDDGMADDVDDPDDTEWNIRKCAAASLDALANLYGDSVVVLVLPQLEQGLTQSNDPWIHEACLLALGAIAGVSSAQTTSFLDKMLPRCVSLLQQKQQVMVPLQSIAAWALSQYATWVIQHALVPTTETLLAHIQSSSPKVQITCLSALNTLIHEAGADVATASPNLYPTLVVILEQQRHQASNNRLLITILDVFVSLAECCPTATDPQHYVPALLQLWDRLASVDPSDTTLLPLMECLAVLAPALKKDGYHPFALETLDTALCMIETVGMFLMEQDDLTDDEVDPIVCATDVVDGLVVCFASDFGALLQSSPRYVPTFGNLVLALLEHAVAAVRTAALALAGDLCRHVPQLVPMEPIVRAAVDNMDPTTSGMTTSMNAIWAIGQVCKSGMGRPVLEPLAVQIVQNLVHVLGSRGMHLSTEERGVAENAAVCMGRLALIDPKFCATEVWRCLLGWCDALGKVREAEERREAFTGFVQTIYANPQSIMQASSNITETLGCILFAILTWHLDGTAVSSKGNWQQSFQPFPPNEKELFAALTRLVGDLKVFAGEQNWLTVQKNLPVAVRQFFREVYQV